MDGLSLDAGSTIKFTVTSASTYGQVHTPSVIVGGHARNRAVLPDYLPNAGASFDLLDWTSYFSGTFSNILLPALSGLTWDTSQLYSTGVISVVGSGSLPGDFNSDGTVNAADYIDSRKGLGTTYSQADYDTWRVHFGETAASGSAAAPASSPAPVPEPSAAVLAFLAVATAAQTRRRRPPQSIQGSTL